MRRFFNTPIRLFVLSALFLTACGSAPQNGDRGLSILASTTFLADIARNVTGAGASVDSLLPIGADPHSYQATPSDVVRISESTVLILNGLEYEHFIESLLENADGERLVITAAEGLEPHAVDEESAESHAEEGEADEEAGHEAGDPHMWLDPNLVVTYVGNIRDGLIQANPEGADAYRANAEAYIAQLEELDEWIVGQVHTIPEARRLLVTNHDTLGYFAERYGFEVVDSILPGFSSDASASAREIAAAIEAIKSTGAPAIFLGGVEKAELANQIAAETGAKVVDDLQLETLTDGAPAATYIDMMKYNVLLIVEALK